MVFRFNFSSVNLQLFFGCSVSHILVEFLITPPQNSYSISLFISNRMERNFLGSILCDIFFKNTSSFGGPYFRTYGYPTPFFFTARLRELQQRAAVAKIEVEVGKPIWMNLSI